MLPSTSRTAFVGSAVVPDAASSGTRCAASLMGSCKLNGCDPSSLNPSTAAFVPVILKVPIATVCPTATVPSWQLRQSTLVLPSVGCTDTFCVVGLVYMPYGCVESVWFHSGVVFKPRCGIWQ